METPEIIGLAFGGAAAIGIVAAWGYVFYRRVIKNEKANLTKRE